VCEAGGKQAVQIEEEQCRRIGRLLDERRWAIIAAQDALPHDDAVTVARFAAGITSPKISKLYRKLPGYGSMSDHSFETLVQAASRGKGTAGRKQAK
jgi:hypothetical protein